MMLFRYSMMSATLHVFCILLVYIANDTLDIRIRSFLQRLRACHCMFWATDCTIIRSFGFGKRGKAYRRSCLPGSRPPTAAIYSPRRKRIRLVYPTVQRQRLQPSRCYGCVPEPQTSPGHFASTGATPPRANIVRKYISTTLAIQTGSISDPPFRIKRKSQVERVRAVYNLSPFSGTRAVDSSQLIGPLDFNVALPRLDASFNPHAAVRATTQHCSVLPSTCSIRAFRSNALAVGGAVEGWDLSLKIHPPRLNRRRPTRS